MTYEPTASGPREGFGLPDFGQLQTLFSDSFQRLIDKLDEIHVTLKSIEGEIRALQQ